MNSPAAKSPYAGYRFPAEVISQAVWLYFRFPLSLRMVEEMLAARGIIVRWDFLPAGKDLMGGRAEACSVVRAALSRPLQSGAVLAPSRTLRPGAQCRGRCAASWTALARGALPVGRSGRKDAGFGRTEG